MISIRRCCCRRYSDDNISFKDIDKYVKDHSAIIIDVRSIQEYRESHINGAINIPVWNIGRNIYGITHNKEQYIVLYCSSGMRSKKAQNILKNMGFKNVFNVNEGFYS